MAIMVDKRQGGGAEEPQRGRRRDEVDWLLLESVVRHPDDLVPFVSRQTGLSRQALNKRVAALVAEGTLEATGATRARTYRWRPVVRVAVTPDLTEDSIWKHHLAPRLVDVAPNVREILQFGATEMINNVIDHSDGSELIVFLRPLESEVELQVQDDGEGLIQKLVRECSFEDARQALLELSKGKLTTDPTRHSGEGIFFTSRMCDKFMIWSDNTCLMRIEGQGFDLTEVAEPRPGTTVRMIVQRDTERTTREVFEQYASEASDYGFTSTSISVNLARDAGDALLSRS